MRCSNVSDHDVQSRTWHSSVPVPQTYVSYGGYVQAFDSFTCRSFLIAFASERSRLFPLFAACLFHRLQLRVSTTCMSHQVITVADNATSDMPTSVPSGGANTVTANSGE